jgi:hypothetical protein
MATITLNVNDEINNEFRNIVKSKFGNAKGNIGKAFEAALKKWINEEKQKEISERQINLMKKGILSLGNWKFDRGEIYGKRGNISC